MGEWHIRSYVGSDVRGFIRRSLEGGRGVQEQEVGSLKTPRTRVLIDFY